MCTVNDYNIENIESQSPVLKELEKKFTPKREDSILLSECYSRLYCKFFNENKQDKADKYLSKFSRVDNCGTLLEFGVTADKQYKLHKANFCKDRLCPMCSWRRTYKIFGQVSKIMNVIENDYKFIFLTLTVPNCYGWELSNLIDKMQKAFNYITYKNKKFKASVCGYFKALEVTHDVEPVITKKMYKKKLNYYKKLGLSVGDVNPNFNKYHPHFHCILAVSPSYFHKEYINHDEWLEIWRNAMHDSSITQVDVRLCKPKNETIKPHEKAAYKKISSAVAEAAKYSVKSNDYLIKDDIDMTDMSVENLFDALSGRRLCTLGGVFKNTLKQLKLDDMENGDLVFVDGEKIRKDLFIQILRYEWSCGAYKLTDVEEVQNNACDIV